MLPTCPLHQHAALLADRLLHQLMHALQINAWFLENRNPETGEYPDLPDEADMGSKVILNPPPPPPPPAPAADGKKGAKKAPEKKAAKGKGKGKGAYLIAVQYSHVTITTTRFERLACQG